MPEKKLYWFKFKDDFFDDIRIKKLRKIAGGDTYTIIYLRLQLLSLKNGGKLYYEGVLDNFSKEIALKLGEDEDDTKITIDYLLNHGLMIQGMDEEYVLPETIECIGSETLAANRVREFRKKQKTLQCNADVTQVKQLCNIDNKIIDNKIEDNKNNNNSLEIKEIVSYLNQKLNSNYRSSTPKTQTLINSRFRDGFKVEDFKNVIDKKYEEWHNTDMEKYLTPETLFGNKFEKYLQQKVQPKKVPSWYDSYKEEEKQNYNAKEIIEEDIEDLQNFFK